MQKLNTFKTAIIVGNHRIDSNRTIIFDEKALEVGINLQNEILGSETICLLDNIDISIPLLSKSLSRSFLRSKSTIVDELASQIPHLSFVVFESSIKNKAKHKKVKFCSLLGQNSYKPLEETRKCSCWGLGAVMVFSLLEAGFEKVIFVTSPDSKQFKVVDAIKLQQFLQNDSRFELIWAK